MADTTYLHKHGEDAMTCSMCPTKPTERCHLCIALGREACPLHADWSD